MNIYSYRCFRHSRRLLDRFFFEFVVLDSSHSLSLSVFHTKTTKTVNLLFYFTTHLGVNFYIIIFFSIKISLGFRKEKNKH